MHFSIDLMKFS